MTAIFLKCKGQETPQTLKSVANCETIVRQQQDTLWQQLGRFQDTYFPDENAHSYNWKYDFENNTIEVFKNGNTYLHIEFIPVGHINVLKKTWTWSWANTLGQTHQLDDVRVFGENNNCEKLKTRSWSGSDRDAWNMVAVANYILKTNGGARHYTSTEYNYVVFTSIELKTK
ncbi:DUF6882 domain-containing protein [uncultured Psychroserpens sp.]|uniref:DUF6882 domain-containing protein n=1 Tax=uncultured Psychroserpens sp. TaxID=255436 RepID=UPI002639CEC5|nr:DUF6882 domain-containing protein [uncultured Psychroserpens sp.]